MDAEERERQAELEEAIQTHRVCWELHPVEAKPLEGERLTVGFELTLTGALCDHDGGTPTLDERLKEVEAVLRKVAADLEEHAGDPDVRSLDIYDVTLQEAPARQFREEAGLKISVLHPNERPDPVDQQLRGCVEEMEARLKALGAHKGRWPSH